MRKIGHEISVPARHAEADGFLAAPSGELFERILGAGLGGNSSRQRGLVKPSTAPGDLGVFDGVGYAKIMEGRKKPPFDSGPEIAFIDEVLFAQAQQISAITAVGRSGQAQKETRLEMADDTPIGRGGGVVEFIDDDIFESIRIETGQMSAARERLDRGEDNIRFGVLLLAAIPAKPGAGAHSPERGHSLGKDLLSMRHKQHPGRVRAVKGGKESLSQPGGEHHQPRPVALRPGCPQRGEGFFLNLVRDRGRFGGFHGYARDHG